MPVDDEPLIPAVVGPAGLHDLAQLLLARWPEMRPHLARRPTECPWVLLGTQQRDVGVVVEHQKVWSPADLDREFRVQTEIHQEPEQPWPRVSRTQRCG